MAYRTLGQLRSVLLARLGMGAMGASGGANKALIDSFLYEAQVALYWMQDWKSLTEYEDKTTGVGQNQYDYPVACERDKRVLRIEVLHAGQWREIHEGITTAMWSTMDSQSFPQRFERLAQILVYPQSDAAYTLRTWYVKDLGPFASDGDVCTIDDSMVLTHALAHAKAHYRQPDSQMYQAALETLLSRIRGQSFSSGGVYRRTQTSEPEPKPAVVGRDV